MIWKKIEATKDPDNKNKLWKITVVKKEFPVS